MSLAPIILFAYNRPQFTRQTLEALAANHLASESTFSICADGPKANAPDSIKIRIGEVRKLQKSDFFGHSGDILWNVFERFRMPQLSICSHVVNLEGVSEHQGLTKPP